MKLLKQLLIATFLAAPSISFGCTDFLLKAKDNSCVIGRSLEFGELLSTQVQIHPKGEVRKAQAPNGQSGITWTSKYSFIGMSVIPANAIMDGFNEAGLSVGILWMPDSKYPAVANDTPAQSVIDLQSISSWFLGNFASVDEAVTALTKVNVYAAPVVGFAQEPPVHFSLHDSSGKSAVVEFLNGKTHVFSNPVGILTNAPEFPWHMTNLRNYIGLSDLNADPLAIAGTVLQPTGQGTGLMGIPGDWTPPSRFVRTAILKRFLQQPANSDEAVVAAIHMLNTVDIPYGIVRGTPTKDFDFTQWIVVKDLKNQKLYVRTYQNQNIRSFDLESQHIVPGSQPTSVNLD